MPTDDPDKIEYDLLELRTQLIFYTAWNIANRDARLVVDPKPEKVSDSYSHSKKELKSFEGLYKSDAFPRMFHFYENDGKLSMFPEGRSKDESMVLDEKGKNKFKMEMAGLEIEFKEGNKMIFKIGGNEILFNLIPPPTEKLGIEKPEQYKEQE